MSKALAAYAPEWLVTLARKKSKPAAQKTAAPTLDIPPAVQNMLSILHPYPEKALSEECMAVAKSKEGTRNNNTNSAAFSVGTLVGGGELDEDVARSKLLEAALKSGLSEAEALKAIESGMTSGKRKPRSIPAKSGTDAQASEESIASAFSTHYADTLRFCKELGCWFEWNPPKHIWVRDKTDKAFDYARRECKALNPGNKASIGKSSTAKGVERFARADPRHATTQDMWDQDPFMLGTPDGAINIKI